MLALLRQGSGSLFSLVSLLFLSVSFLYALSVYLCLFIYFPLSPFMHFLFSFTIPPFPFQNNFLSSLSLLSLPLPTFPFIFPSPFPSLIALLFRLSATLVFSYRHSLSLLPPFLFPQLFSVALSFLPQSFPSFTPFLSAS